jgi:hypothetical protein
MPVITSICPTRLFSTWYEQNLSQNCKYVSVHRQLISLTLCFDVENHLPLTLLGNYSHGWNWHCHYLARCEQKVGFQYSLSAFKHNLIVPNLLERWTFADTPRSSRIISMSRTLRALMLCGTNSMNSTCYASQHICSYQVRCQRKAPHVYERWEQKCAVKYAS